MSLETKSQLTDETLASLQELIQVNIDSTKGFLEASEKMEDKTICSAFIEMSNQRAKNASELQNYVQWNGEQPYSEGSFAGMFHRTWIDIKSAFTAGNTHTILAEAERGEDYIKKMYENILVETAGSAMNDVLTRQYATVKAGHDRVRAMRDQSAEK